MAIMKLASQLTNIIKVTAPMTGEALFYRITEGAALTTTSKLNNLLTLSYYHGTTVESMGDQLAKGQFDANADHPRLYFTDFHTAAKYATRTEVGEPREGTPLLLRIDFGKLNPTMNESTETSWSGLGGLAPYKYVRPADGLIKIIDWHKLELLAPEELESMAEQATSHLSIG